MTRLPRIESLAPEASGWGFFLCTQVERRPTRGGDVLVLRLQDASGQITAKILDDVDRWRHAIEPGEFVRVEAAATLYNEQWELVISDLRRVNPERDRFHGFRAEDCLLSAPRSIDEMWAELEVHLQAVSDSSLRVLLNRIVADHGAQLREWPAAQSVHHAYRGGLLEHVVAVIGVVRVLARTYHASEDLVIAGAVLHDIGKLQELEYDRGVIAYSRAGNLVGHIGLGVSMLREVAQGISGFPEGLRTELEHLVLSHHGSKERGSPVEPKTVEAFILAAADELDARMNQVRHAIKEDAGAEDFTAWHRRLGRVLYKGGSS